MSSAVCFNLDQSKILLSGNGLKAFEDNKIYVTENLNFVLRRVENIVAKGEYAGCQHFLLFLQSFQKASSSRLLKDRIVQ